MKTIDEILNEYDKYRVFLDDRFGSRLCRFLTEEQANKIGFGRGEGMTEWPEPEEFTRENVLKQLESDVAFGFEKALNMRGISSSLMADVVTSWNKVLEEGLEDFDQYPMYGLLIFKATAIKYGWDNPIGDDTGSESCYGS